MPVLKPNPPASPCIYPTPEYPLSSTVSTTCYFPYIISHNSLHMLFPLARLSFPTFTLGQPQHSFFIQFKLVQFSSRSSMPTEKSWAQNLLFLQYLPHNSLKSTCPNPMFICLDLFPNLPLWILLEENLCPIIFVPQRLSIARKK